MDKVKIIPKGALFLITTAMYEDHYPKGLFRALEDIDKDKLERTFEAYRKSGAENTLFENFFSAFCEKVEYFEVHKGLGGYEKGRWPMVFTMKEGPDSID